jgi:hypothetical protein
METERRLEQMGFAPPQARGLAGLFEETATAIQQDLKSFIAAQTEIIRSDMKAMEERLRNEIRLSEERLRAEFHKDLQVQLFRFVSIQTLLIGGFFTLFKFVFPGTGG